MYLIKPKQIWVLIKSTVTSEILNNIHGHPNY